MLTSKQPSQCPSVYYVKLRLMHCIFSAHFSLSEKLAFSSTCLYYVWYLRVILTSREIFIFSLVIIENAAYFYRFVFRIFNKTESTLTTANITRQKHQRSFPPELNLFCFLLFLLCASHQNMNKLLIAKYFLSGLA